MSILSKFLDVIEILLVNNNQVLIFKKYFFVVFNFNKDLNLFVENAKIISTIKFKKHIVNTNILVIIISKLIY